MLRIALYGSRRAGATLGAKAYFLLDYFCKPCWSARYSSITIFCPVSGSMTSSHYFVLTIPASETSPVIYMTAPTEAEVGQTYKRIDEVLKSFCFRWTIWHCFLSFSVQKCLRRWVLAAIKEFSRNPICRFIGRTPLLLSLYLTCHLRPKICNTQ